MTESLGKSQVLNYIENIETSSDIHILSFEDDPETAEIREVKTRIDSQQIEWHRIERSRGPVILSTIVDLILGFFFALLLFVKNDFDIVHARSYIPMILVLPFGVFPHTSLVFDIRGFWIDERVDRGSISDDGLLYRVLKNIERLLYRQADLVITLTKASEKIIKRDYSVEEEDIYVIPTCVDTAKFMLSNETSNDVFRLGYVGTVNEWHHFDEVLDCYRILSEQVDNPQLKIYNKGDKDRIERELENYSVELENIQLESAPYSEMPKKYAELDAGIFFYKSTYSKKATCPTKMGEFLATGTPCLGNRGVGDVGDILEGNQVGIAISEFSESEKRDAISDLINVIEDPESSPRCREVAIDQFSLEYGADKLQEIYSNL